MILVTGATSNLGVEVVNAALGRGKRVRGLVRDRATAFLPAPVDAVERDLNNPDTFADAFEGISGGFLVADTTTRRRRIDTRRAQE